MWIVKIALSRPYTFIVLGLLILILSPVVILQTPTDIFPNIDIPVIAVSWDYAGLSPAEMEGRITSVYERVLTTTVDNIEHIESTTINGTAVVRVYLQPNASVDKANAQVTAISQAILRQMPQGVLPPLILNYSASAVPVLQLGLSGNNLSEPQLNDLAINFLRTQLVTVPGASIPYPYGGKTRQAMVTLNQQRLQSKGLSANDVLVALQTQNLIEPGGTAKIDQFEYDVDLNSDAETIPELNDLPIKTINGTTIYVRDVATVSDGFAPQKNIVRLDGKRGVLLTVFKAGDASTIDIVKKTRQLLPRVAQTLPPALRIQPLTDQSIFVRGAVNGVVREAIIAATLTGLMILLFLGSWRSTVIIAISIPLSILSSVIALSFLHQTINIMTLGGLALAVGILVDDATVTIENIERHFEEGANLHDGILEGAAQIATPALVSTMCICIVFLPMFFLKGVPKFLFIPLAEAVIFAMIASYILSRTLVPTLAMFLLKPHDEHAKVSNNIFSRFQRGFEKLFLRFRGAYHSLLEQLVLRRKIFVPTFLLLCICVFVLIPFLGQDFFPESDSGHFIVHLRAKTGTRVEETARLADEVEQYIRTVVPADEMDNILDNIGLPFSSINYMYNTSGLTGEADADILVSLKEKHRPTKEYVRSLRANLANRFPGDVFYFLPGDIVTQTLNFGLPAPVDIQIEGADVAGNTKVAGAMLSELRHVPGLTDIRVQEQQDYPKLHINVDRTEASQAGFTEHDVVNSMLVALSGSFQVSPMYYLNPKNGVQYSIVVQNPQYGVQSDQDIKNIPVSSSNQAHQGLLTDVSTIHRTMEPGSINHYNIRRVVDIYAAVQDRDLRAVGREVNRIVDGHKKELPRGSFVTLRGQFGTMQSAYMGLIGGLIFSILLVYMLIVVNFQSWLDPFVIVMALPAALAGIVMFLFITHTSLSVPALMGAIMCMGVATANSILVVSFAKERLGHHGDPVAAAIEAGSTRFRPVLMTALAMIIGMIPMALGFGDGGEQNAPLGRAVIGGLLIATVATLVFVPSVFSLVHKRIEKIPEENHPEQELSART
ncbi:efflux RND transporter permease subunit [Tunturiibacter gelidoferens]|uniref:CzcA family heavy metal efflux pump n=1 Tax=Tunturiibacter gelidiferens TaxID=3069689 RepID=A0A9X0QH45_9BACT|nr:efflux RND transporter permease subunit [Edaphobacter lichenicola]MBB5330361.1 CzcA family heavy metal efflux pump [Edaphobacter lichenicola]